MRKLLLALCLALPWVTQAQDAPKRLPPATPYRALVLQALTCRGDSLQIVRDIAQHRAQAKAEGIDAKDNGMDGEDEAIELHFSPALQWLGASTTKVVLSFESGRPDFYAPVHALFEGAAEPWIANLKLVQAHKLKVKSGVGVYASPVSHPERCPPQVGLTPTGPQRFLLGCGWCNGG
ncbi:MAG: hypothetical protein RI907_249 [Pseudomonadota bacterium]|jgi:hypothetical protein